VGFFLPGLNPSCWAGFVVGWTKPIQDFFLFFHFPFFYKNRDFAKFKKIIEKSENAKPVLLAS
jgi:hypothetical protein